MGKLSRGKSGGVMNVIRCDEQKFLMWKWRPLGESVNTTSRENGIRFGSQLSVRPGQMAVFQYRKDDGAVVDTLVGPYDGMVRTANLPVLSNIMGMAYGGETPFQAEVYFINIAGIIKESFVCPYFTVVDSRFPDLPVRVAVHGEFRFRISDVPQFIVLHALRNYTMHEFIDEVQSKFIRHIENAISDCVKQQISPVQLSMYKGQINDYAEAILQNALLNEFAIRLTSVDITDIIINQDENFKKLTELTHGAKAQISEERVLLIIKNMRDAQELNTKNMRDFQTINATDTAERLRINRDATERELTLGIQTNYMGAHALNLQADILKTGMQNLGQMGTMSSGSGEGGFNPAAAMAGMAMGQAVGMQASSMMNDMGQAMRSPSNTPPPPPGTQLSFHVVVGGNSQGPFNMAQLHNMAGIGQLTPDTLVWKKGMANWSRAGDVSELISLFNNVSDDTPPPVPSA